MKIKLMMYMVMFITGVTIYAQETVIHGKITDKKGNPVDKTIIKLKESEKFTETDADGLFKIEADSGQLAEIIHVNYRSEIVKLYDNIQIILSDECIALDNIVIKADPFDQIAQSEIINDDIKAISQPRNVSDLFKDIPGFAIQKRGAYASEPVFRSFKYEQLNVMYDGGMKIIHACPNRMDPITTHIIPEEVERIEVIRGPFSMRFGPNFGGIINMVSKSGRGFKRGISGNIESGYETNGNNFTGRGNLMFKAEKFDIEFNGSYRNYGDYKDGNGIVVPSSFTTTDYSVKVGVDPAENQRLRFTWRQSFGKDIMHAGLMMDSPYDDSFLTGLDYKITKIGNMVKSLSFKAFYSYVDHLMTNENRPSFKKTGASSNVFATNFGGKTELILEPNENLKIFTGVDANFIGRDGDRIRTIKIINGIPLPEPKIKVDKIWQDSKVNDIGIYAEAKYLFGDSGVLTAGLRTDFVTASINDPEKDFLELYEGQIDDQHEPNVSGTVSYVYTTGNSQWQFAFGRGVRTASMPERFINHFNIGSDPYEYVGNPYLKPEKNNQFEISFRQDNKRIDYGITAFYSILKDYISAVVDKDLPRKFMPTVPPLFAKRYINIDNAFQTGFEAFFNVKIIEDFEFQSDFAYTYGQNNDFDEPLPQVMPMTVHLGLLYDKDSYWFHLKSRIVSKQDRISETFMEKETPGFNTIDLSAGVKPLKGLSVGAAILNIFDTAFYEHLNFSYKNSSFLQGRIYEPGRNFTVYVNYSF